MKFISLIYKGLSKPLKIISTLYCKVVISIIFICHNVCFKFNLKSNGIPYAMVARGEKGVPIGENSIIGTGSVVTKSVPDNQIWAGNPAKFIRNIK